MVETTYYNIQDVFDAEYQPTVFGKVSNQLIKLYTLAKQFEQPTILECGVNQGWSTGLFALACEELNGYLISVDINDCSDAIVSEKWHFIQSDDSDQGYIFEQAPILKSGIDVIYIDSLHAGHHVAKLIDLYYPYINQGGYLAFDDVDSGPYMQGQRKDDANREVGWRDIAYAAQDFFYANEDDLLLEFHYGSTGLGIMKKLAPRSKVHQPARHIPRRYHTWRSIAKRLLGRSR